ncbi:MAG: hypothetical protein E5Y51_23895, partial [Mesorhizobium sp.]
MAGLSSLRCRTGSTGTSVWNFGVWCQSTVERIVALLRDFGVSISKRQVVRILTRKIDAFVAEAKQVLTA